MVKIMNALKKKTIIVASESVELFTTKRLMTEATNLGFKTTWLNPYQHLLTCLQTPQPIDSTSLYFHRTSGIRYDDFDLLVTEHHQDLGFTVTNPLHSLELFRDKGRQALFFGRHQLPQIDSLSFRGEISESYLEAIKEMAPHEKYVLKMTRGNQGIGVNLVNGLQSLKSLLETFCAMKDQKFLIQPFIEHQREWRIFVIKNEIVAVIERQISQEDFRGNSKRSTGKSVLKLPKTIETEVLRGVKLSGLDYCGVDVLENNQHFSILEMNPVPGFLQIEELTGQNIALELIQRLLKSH
jgi:RimK family alpha-L-glutamate ligase